MRSLFLTPVFLCASLTVADAGSFLQFEKVINEEGCLPEAVLKDFDTGTVRRFVQPADMDKYYNDEVRGNPRMNDIDRRLTRQAIDAAKKELQTFFEPGCLVI